MRKHVVAMLLLSACRQGEGKDTVSTCEEPAPSAPPEYPEYAMLAASFAWQAAPVEGAVNVDVGSFTRNTSSLTDAEVISAVENALTYWNSAGAALTLTIGDTALDCCTSTSDTDCTRMCTTDDDNIDIKVTEGRDPEELAAAEMYPKENGACMLSCDIVFYTIGRDAAHMEWVYSNVTDDDSTDGYYEKPFYNTVVHELLHCLGLGDNRAESTSCSVTYYNEETGAGCDYTCCSFDVPSDIDATALRYVYGAR